MRRDPLPDWPPVMHEDWAAAYLSLSTSTFRSVVVKDVPPIALTQRRVGWLRADLDQWLAKRAGADASSGVVNPWPV